MNGWMRRHCSIRETARFAKCRPGGAALLFLLSVGLHGTGCRDGRTLKRTMTHLSLGNFHTITGPKAALGESPLGSRLKRGDECTWALLLRLKGGRYPALHMVFATLDCLWLLVCVCARFCHQLYPFLCNSCADFVPFLCHCCADFVACTSAKSTVSNSTTTKSKTSNKQART